MAANSSHKPTRRAALRLGAASLFVHALPAPVYATATDVDRFPVPEWFLRDVKRNAFWLPVEVKKLGILGAYQERLKMFESDLQDEKVHRELERQGLRIKYDDIRKNLDPIPAWMIALACRAHPDQVDAGMTVVTQKADIIKQIYFMPSLSGPPLPSEFQRRFQQLLAFSGAAYLPTPGDRVTGYSLGSEGCAAAPTHYPLAQVMAEYAKAINGRLDERLADAQSHHELIRYFNEAKKKGFVEIVVKPFLELQHTDFPPGVIAVGYKMDGAHVSCTAEAPTGYDLKKFAPQFEFLRQFVGNTGLSKTVDGRKVKIYHDHSILMQEFVCPPGATAGAEMKLNPHRQIVSHQAIEVNGNYVLGDPRTNVYYANAMMAMRMHRPGLSNFTIIHLPKLGLAS